MDCCQYLLIRFLFLILILYTGQQRLVDSIAVTYVCNRKQSFMQHLNRGPQRCARSNKRRPAIKYNRMVFNCGRNRSRIITFKFKLRLALNYTTVQDGRWLMYSNNCSVTASLTRSDFLVANIKVIMIPLVQTRQKLCQELLISSLIGNLVQFLNQ